MSSRLDYLSKYVLGNTSSEKKKKRKGKLHSHKSDSSTHLLDTRIVVGNSSLPIKPDQAVAEIENNVKRFSEPADLDDEEAPVHVENLSAPKANKGFKRIDNGEVRISNDMPNASVDSESQFVSNDTKIPAEQLTQGETIYRDLSGRIVDLKDKLVQMKERNEKDAEEKESLRVAINTGDVDKVRLRNAEVKQNSAKRHDVSKTSQEYVAHMKQKEQFDDPLLAFTAREDKSIASLSGRPQYDKGTHPVNRFDIPAGFFWDGIDRSNGFERKIVLKRNETKMQNLVEANTKESYTEYDFE